MSPAWKTGAFANNHIAVAQTEQGNLLLPSELRTTYIIWQEALMTLAHVQACDASGDDRVPPQARQLL